MMNDDKNKKIRTIEDLDQIKKEFAENKEQYRYRLLLCSGSGCVSSGCKEVRDSLLKELEKEGLLASVDLSLTGCIGICDVGPRMSVLPEGVFYCKLKPEDMKKIVKGHLLGGQIVEECCYADRNTGQRVPYMQDIDFFKGQNKVVLRDCGMIDYRSMDEYIFHDGYYSLAKVLNEFSPAQVIDEIKKSGLRGRGGGGFPTGTKWQLAAKAKNDQKYVICNADEGDPGAFMDRSLMEGNPHLVLEGMAIAGYAIGASKGYVYIRAEYPLALEGLEYAIQEAKDKSILGENIFGSGFDFDVEIRIGAGAFVCGEETALMASVEGRRGEPRQKPPFPAESGLFGKPTVINNVETLGNVPIIIREGALWFSELGTEKSKGTKVFALAGDIQNTGLIEVPMGLTLGEIIYDIGGGIPKGKKFKVAQTGGPSGGCLTKEHLNTPVDYDSLVELGAIMGSGGLICMDEDTCMV
ncbi:MAG TPA: SLBB domain-containing protein, partial [Anaerovoracaceae bacterium]|nr:SLBB domain-containing protein [Anaerovoracaceae bacterium]